MCSTFREENLKSMLNSCAFEIWPSVKETSWTGRVYYSNGWNLNAELKNTTMKKRKFMVVFYVLKNITYSYKKKKEKKTEERYKKKIMTGKLDRKWTALNVETTFRFCLGGSYRKRNTNNFADIYGRSYITGDKK